jgi:MFS family permease
VIWDENIMNLELKIDSGCATSMPMAIVGRFVTGTGGAGMMDLVSIILCKMTLPSEVGPLRGYLSLGITLGVSCGPPLGGVFTDTVGWRWYLNFKPQKKTFDMTDTEFLGPFSVLSLRRSFVLLLRPKSCLLIPQEDPKMTIQP